VRVRLTAGTIGSAMALSAGAVWSFGAITARLADGSDAFQYLAWRSIGIIVVIEGWRLARRRPSSTIRAFTSGSRMWIANLSLLFASIGFIYAVKTTSAATAAFLGSTTPLFGVASARVFLGERINWRTIVAIAFAFGGLTMMLAGDMSGGSIVGDLAAISSAVGFAMYTTVVRSAPHRDWSPVLPGYGVMMIAICVVVTLADGKALVPPIPDIALALLHGGLFIVAGTMLYNGASRNVPAAAMTVFAQTEMVLVPVWAFVVLAERPAPTTLAGGTVILAAVVGKALLDARHEARLAAANPPPEPHLAPAG
jgi:drug/metabolite transporter (DMT)-like permease